MAVPVSDLQGIAPSAIIELFELQLNTAQHGTNDIYRFHAGANLNNNGQLVWAGNSYLRFPLEADGFEYSGNGQLPRPKIRVSNILGTITALLLTLPEGLEGAKVTRIRTLARYLDAVNFPGNVNPLGTPDPTAEFPREIYFIDRKSSETRDVVEYELAASFDLAGVRSPKRQCVSNICQWVYKSVECGFVPTNAASGTYIRRSFTGTYSQTGTTITVSSTSHGALAGDNIYLTRDRVSAVTYTYDSTVDAGIIITLPSHGYGVGEEVNLTFSPGDQYVNGNYVIAEASSSDTFAVAARPESFFYFAFYPSGDVTVTPTVPTSGFVTVTSASADSFTFDAGTSATEAGNISASLLRVSINGHGLTVGATVNLDFTSGGASDAAFIVSAVDTNTFTVQNQSGDSTSGNVTTFGAFDINDNPVPSVSQDECGKRLASCKARFGSDGELPFGSFPGIGFYFT